MSGPQVESLPRVTPGEVARYVAAAFRRHPLEEGCDHQLIRFPLFQFSIDYLCTACHGYHERAFTGLAALAMAEIDRIVAGEVGGTVVAEVDAEYRGGPR